MKENDAAAEIQRMSIAEKIAALSQVDKAYVRGYVERAVFQTLKEKRKNPRKKTKT